MEEIKQESIRLTIIGCGDAFASGGRFNTCFYLDFMGEPVLVDCGASSLVGLKKQGINLASINIIVLSHLHGDHFGGIPFFLIDAKHQQKREAPLTIIGPKDTDRRIRELTSLLYPGTELDSLGFKVNLLEYVPNKNYQVGDLEIQAFPVIHSQESHPHGLRITAKNNKVFAYSGDTEWTDVLLDIAKDSDLFICESNYFDKKGPNHLDYITLKANRNRLTCKKLLINHLGTEMLERMEELDLECAYDGQAIIF